VNLVAGAYYLRWRFARELQRPAGLEPVTLGGPVRLLPWAGWRMRLARHPVLVLFPVTILVLVTLDVTAAVVRGPEVPVWLPAGVGAVVLLAVTPARLRVVRQVNWEVLVLFAGLFVVVGGVVHGGLVQAGEAALPLAGPGRPVAGLATIVLSSSAGAQLVSNVPWVALQIPLLSAAGYGPATPVAWVALAAASTLAGNMTVLGAASNVIVVDLAEKAGVKIGLRTFVQDGLPIAALSLGVLFLALLVGL
jgi:Na+/H+ antiporter NhaD/arsenite permease-like protein